MIRCALPCLHFDLYERKIIQEHGFMTFPQFLDNDFISDGKPNISKFEKRLRQYGYGLIHFAVCPDCEPEKARELKARYPKINWIYPLHSRNEDISDFEWIGFPHDEERRDYDLNIFLRLTEGKKRWYLGFWDESHPEVLLLFDGFDTTLPEKYSGKYGRLWLGWGKSKPANPLFMPTIEIFEFNVLSFKFALIELFTQNRRDGGLLNFI